MPIFSLIQLIFIPSIALGIMMSLPKKREKVIASLAIGGVVTDFLVYIAILNRWFTNSFVSISQNTGVLSMGPSYTFIFDWYFDATSAVFFGLTCLVTLLILIFSKYYMHRDRGFLRYFGTIMFFFIGLSIVILSGNFEVLFLGWEWIGISSFLLIGYYRDRFLPVRNSLKVFSLYRIADAIMLIAIWMSHHIFERAIEFSSYQNIELIKGYEFVIIGLLFFLVAWIKSAQFPFSYWLPRAMEGPTTSSAIFYGALSVHMGLFILLRTYPFWQSNITLRLVLITFGLITASVATSITRVQSSIKTQIAYASITQIGIMFIEIAVGLPWLALIHMVSNACLRTYQLLISPSIVGYLIHDQFYHFVKPDMSIPGGLIGKLKATLFVLSIKEWNMNAVVTNYIWKPIKSVGRWLSFLDKMPIYTVWYVFLLTVLLVIFTPIINSPLFSVVSIIITVISIVFFIRAYSTKNTPQTAWNLIMIGQLLAVLEFLFSTTNTRQYLLVYCLGLFIPFSLGSYLLNRLEKHGEATYLFDYNGHVYEYPRVAFVFLICSLGIMIFPMTPIFLIQDMLLNSIPPASWLLVILFGFSYLIGGISIMRLYTKVFLGPHKKRYHEVSAKSA